MRTIRLALVYLLLNPYRHDYRSALRDGLPPAYARHLWRRAIWAGVRNLGSLLREAHRSPVIASGLVGSSTGSQARTRRSSDPRGLA